MRYVLDAVCADGNNKGYHHIGQIEKTGHGLAAQTTLLSALDNVDIFALVVVERQGKPLSTAGCRPPKKPHSGGPSMERRKREDGEPTEQTTDSSLPKGYIYRGVRYGEGTTDIRDEPAEEPETTDDPVDLSVMLGDPPPAPATREEPAGRPAADLPWWETGPTFGEPAGEAREDAGEPEADAGPGFFYRGIRYGEPEREPPAEEPEAAAAKRDAGEPDLELSWWRRTPAPAKTAEEEKTEPPAEASYPRTEPAFGDDPASREAPAVTLGGPGGEWLAEHPAESHPVGQEERAGERTEHSEGDFAGEGLAVDRVKPEQRPPEAPAGLPAAAGTPSEDRPEDAIRALAAEICPGDLLMVEMIGAPVPEWAGPAVNTARDDLERRVAARQPVDASEYLRLAIVENVMGLHDEAEAHLKEAMPLSDRLGPVLNALAVTNLARGMIPPAVVYAKEALQESGGDDGVCAMASSNLAEFYRLQGNEAQAAEAYETAIDGLGPEGDALWLARLRLRASRLHRRTGQTDKARMHLSDSVRLFRDSGDGAGQVQALAELGSILTESGSHDLAVRNLEEGIRICLRTGDRSGASLVQHAIGVAFMGQNQLTRALAYLDSALTLYRDLGNRKGEAATLGYIAKIHESRGDVDEAQRFYEAAKRLDDS